MSALTVSVYQVYFTMNYGGQWGYKGQYKKPIGTYSILPRRINFVERDNTNVITIGAQPVANTFGYYPTHLNIDGRFLPAEEKNGPASCSPGVASFNNIFIPGMAVTMVDTTGALTEINGKAWLVAKYRTERNKSRMFVVNFSLELIEYKLLDEIEGGP